MITMCPELGNINKSPLYLRSSGGEKKRNKEVHSLHIDRALRENNVYIHIKVKKMISSSFLLKRNYPKEKEHCVH